MSSVSLQPSGRVLQSLTLKVVYLSVVVITKANCKTRNLAGTLPRDTKDTQTLSLQKSVLSKLFL